MEGSTLAASSFNQATVDWRRPPPPIDPSQAPPWPEDAAAIERFQKDGAIVLRGVFEEWVEPLRAGLERNLKAPQDYAFPCESAPDGEPGRFFDSYCNWLLIPEYLDHVSRSCAASMAGHLMRSRRTQFFHEHAFCKEPGTQRATPWHQDLPYYCVDGTQTVSLYVSLDEVPAEVAVRFVRGSHRWGRLFYPRVFLDGADFNTDDDGLETVPDIDAHPQSYDIAAWDLEPGDVIAFDFRTLHGTTAGTVHGRRRALSTRWLGDDVTYCRRPGETSPPFPDIGLEDGEPMREDWFPVMWRKDGEPDGTPPA